MKYHIHIEIQVDSEEDADWAAQELAAFASDWDSGVVSAITDENGDLVYERG